MKVAYVCPACRDTINAPPSLQGESSPCPKCNADVDRWPAPVSSPGSVRIVPQPPPVAQAVWFYSVNGARRGPVTTGQLKSLVEGAALRPNDLIWREELPPWVEAGTVPELFPASAPPKPVPPPVPVPVAPPPVAQPAPPPSSRVVEWEDEDEEEDRRPRRRRERDRDRDRGGFRCPYCGSTARPLIRQQVSPAGWVVFSLLLVAFSVFLVFLGFLGLLMDLRPGGWAVYALILMNSVALPFASLLIKEEVVYCRECKSRVGR